jgi:hypothetical protein
MVQVERLPQNGNEFAIVDFYKDGDYSLGIVVYAPNRGHHFYLSDDDFLDGGHNNVEKYGYAYAWALRCDCAECNQIVFAEGSITDIEIHSDALFESLPSNVRERLGTPIADEVTECVEDVSTEVADDSESFIAEGYTQDIMFSDEHGYHYHHGRPMNRPIELYRGHRIGIELEVEFHTESQKDEFAEKKSNWFYLEHDGSLDGCTGIEIITIPLLPKDAKNKDFWKPLTSYLGGVASSWDTSTCGLHVHIGREILGRNEAERSESLGKLLYLYHHYVKDTRLNINIYGRERGYSDTDGKTHIGDAAKIFGSKILKDRDCAEKVRTEMINKSQRGGRYFDINIQNNATIEFRKGRGSINPKRIAMVVEYSERLALYAKSTPWGQISYEDFIKYLRATTQNEEIKNRIDSYA